MIVSGRSPVAAIRPIAASRIVMGPDFSTAPRESEYVELAALLGATQRGPVDCDDVIDRPLIVQRIRRVFAASFVALGIKLAATSQ